MAQERPGTINSLETDDAEVAIVVAAHNAALALRSGGAGSRIDSYVAAFTKAYRGIVEATGRGDVPEEEDEDEEEEDEDEEEEDEEEEEEEEDDEGEEDEDEDEEE